MDKNLPLKLAIVGSGLTQYEVARKCGLHETRLSQLVTLRVKPTEHEKEALSRVLGRDKNDLFLTG